MSEIRVRFAPSPTGGLHIGGVRTALYNYLLARQHGGKMILRIEDTDQGRFVPGAEEYIKQSLKWVGITIDEGPDEGGPYGPYKQSERKEIYARYAQQLIDAGCAYYAFDSAEDLESMRDRLKKEGNPDQQYGSGTRMGMKNSLTLTAAEVDKLLSSGVPYVIRLKVAPDTEIKIKDIIRGEVIVNSSQVDDKVLMKSDGMPTYHLANVVDDYLMKISHVIRGEEWLPSAPLHVLLYQYLGWKEQMPQFAHLPLLLKPDGNGKLSKRDADRMGFPIFPLTWTDPNTHETAKGFRESGYLPEALVNFLALLGWNPGTEQELFSMDELIQAFSLNRIGKAGARFDIQKATWFNQHYLRRKSDEELAHYLITSLASQGIACATPKAIAISAAMRERISFPDDLWSMSQFFFIAPSSYDPQIAAKKWSKEAVSVLQQYAQRIATIDSQFDSPTIKSLIEKVAGDLQVPLGKVMPALRLALTGGASGPDLMVTMEILGPDEVGSRILNAIRAIGS